MIYILDNLFLWVSVQASHIVDTYGILAGALRRAWGKELV